MMKTDTGKQHSIFFCDHFITLIYPLRYYMARGIYILRNYRRDMPLTRMEAKVLQDLTQKIRERLQWSIMPVFEIAHETPEKFGEIKVDTIAKKHEHMIAVFEMMAEVSALLRVDEQD